MTHFHIVLKASNISAAIRIGISPLTTLFIILEVASVFMAR